MKKSKRGFVREMALLVSPLVIIGGAALWVTHQPRKDPTYRTVLTRVEQLSVSPAEAWLGFDRKIRLSFTIKGEAPQQNGIELLDNFIVEGGEKTRLTGIRGGKTQTLKVNADLPVGRAVQPGPLVLLRSQQFGNIQTICFLANTSSFQENEVSIEGTVHCEQQTIIQKSFAAPPKGFARNYYAVTRSLPFRFVLRRADEAVAPQVNKETVTARAGHGRLVLLHTEQHPEVPRDWGKYQGEIEVPNVGQENAESPTIQFFRVELHDQKRKLIGRISHGDWRPLEPSPHKKPGWIVAPFEVQWWGMDTSWGPLWVSGLVSVRGSWPTPFSVQVRSMKDISPPRDLQLKEVRFAPPNQVQVALHYSGKKILDTLEPRHRVPYARRDGTTLLGPPRQNGHDRLLSHWSERLQYSPSQYGDTTFYNYPEVQATGVDTQPNGDVLVTYTLLRPSRGLTFKADIGLEEEGFVHVDYHIPQFQ